MRPGAHQVWVAPHPDPGAGPWFAKLREHNQPHPTNRGANDGNGTQAAGRANTVRWRESQGGTVRRVEGGVGHTRRETEAEGCCQALHRNIATDRRLEAVPPTLWQAMAAPARFERTTFPLGGGRSIQLSYGALPGILS